jgi:AcrR family transcriptional regulator
MNRQAPSGRDRIYSATINIMGKEGIQALTTRRIAQEAGVNIAAINYYYGSKDKLVEEVMNGALDEMAGFPSDLLDAEALEVQARLQAFFQGLLGSIVKYPGLVKALLYAPLVNNDYSTPFVRRFQQFMEDVHTKLKDRNVELKGEDADRRLALVQMISAVVLPAVFIEIFEPFAGVHFKDPEILRQYASSLLDRFFEKAE